MYLQFPTSQPLQAPKKAPKSPEKATSKDEILVKKKQLRSFTSKIKMSKNRAVISYVMKENLLRKIQKRNKTKQSNKK